MKNLHLILVIPLFIASCGFWFTPIGKINASPREYAGKEVHVKGTVTDTTNILMIKYFTIKDDTGEITVVTDRPLPLEGDKAEARGRVEEAFSIGDSRLLVIVEGDNKSE